MINMWSSSSTSLLRLRSSGRSVRTLETTRSERYCSLRRRPVARYFTISGEPDAMMRFRVKNVDALQRVVNAIRPTGKVAGTKTSEYGALVAHIIGNPVLNGETIRLDSAVRMAAK